MADDNPDFKAAQKNHADELRMERNLTRITGLNKSQVRERLRSFAGRVQLQQATLRQRTTPGTFASRAREATLQKLGFMTKQKQGGAGVPPAGSTAVFLVAFRTAEDTYETKEVTALITQVADAPEPGA